MITCKKCGSTNIDLRLDDRGVAHAYCKDCGAHIKIMSTTEVMDFYTSQLVKYEQQPKEEKDQPLCKYCTERYVMVQGNPSVRQQYVPLTDIKYCPMCGRRLREDDRKY